MLQLGAREGPPVQLEPGLLLAPPFPTPFPHTSGKGVMWVDAMLLLLLLWAT